jgi:hypothetical protein
MVLVGTLTGTSPAATPAFGSATSAATASPAASLVLPRPAGAGAGHVLVAAVAFRVEGAIAAPAGWTAAVQTTCLASGVAVSQAVFVRAAGPSEPGSYAFSVGSASGGAGAIVAYSGVDGTHPVDAAGGQISRNTAAIIAPSVTTTVPGALLVGAFAGSGRAATPPPAGMTLRADVATGTAAPAERLVAADQLLASAGATGERRAKAAASNTCNVGQAVALRPGPDPPVATSPPLVSGIAQVGAQLAATAGAWTNAPTSFSYRWERGPGWTAVGTGAAYAPSEADVGASLRVVVTAANAGGSGSSASAPTAPVLPAAPTSLVGPSVAGLAREHETLAAEPGAWTGAPTAYAYRWQRSGDGGQSWTDVDGATGASQVLTGADVGFVLRVVVTASNAGGSASAASPSTAEVAPAAPPVPPASVEPPSVPGVPRVGIPTTAVPGTWTGWPGSYAYRWRRSADGGQTWTEIEGATAAEYVPAAADAGRRLGVTVTATNAAGSGTAASPPSEIVLPPAPESVSPPVVTGAPIEGATLAASTGEWTGALSHAFAWQRCAGAACEEIRWEVDPTYVVRDDDVGFTIRAVVTAWNLGGSATAVSAPTASVLPRPPVNEEAPSVSGIAGQGETLTADPGRWESAAPVAYAYTWQRSLDGSAWDDIAGATGTTYVLLAADVGHVFRVLVAASNAGGSTELASAPTGVVSAPGLPVNVSLPTLSGVVQQGGRLTAEPGTWSGLPTYTYAWQRSSDGGATWSTIARARTFRYTLAGADVGRRVRAVVTAKNAFGSATAYSPGQEIFAADDRAILVNATWYCNGPVDLELLKVTNTDGVFRDAARFDGCSGRIARVEIETDGADGLKIRNTAPVAHDLELEGGWVRCTEHADGAHQDGIQVMGGARLAFRNLVIWCGDPDEQQFGDGVNAAVFVNTGGGGDTTPTDVVVEHSVAGPGSANGVLIGESVRSGLRNSVACPDWTPNGGPVAIDEDAVEGIDEGNEKPPADDPRCASFEAALAWAAAPPGLQSPRARR